MKLKKKSYNCKRTVNNEGPPPKYGEKMRINMKREKIMKKFTKDQKNK